jgi:hypothetical protein
MTPRWGASLVVLLTGLWATACIAPPPIPDGTAAAKRQYSPEIEAVISTLSSQRGQIGRPPPTVVADLVDMATDDAVELERGSAKEKDAVQKLLRQAVWQFGNRSDSFVVRGWLLTGPSLDRMGFPPAVIHASTVKCAMGIVHPKNKGELYGVLFVAQLPGDVMVNQQFDL